MKNGRPSAKPAGQVSFAARFTLPAPYWAGSFAHLLVCTTLSIAGSSECGWRITAFWAGPSIMAYVDNGTVSDGDGEILVALNPVHKPTADYVAQLRQELPRQFPGCTFYFEPADITSQILNFGLPAPIDVQVVGVNREANLAVAHKLRRELAKIPGIADVHLHQMTDRPDLRLNVDRTMASEVG